MSKVYYMKVGKPPLMLPEAVAETVTELAELTGNTAGTIYSKMSHSKKDGTKCRFIKVEVEDEEECGDRTDKR